MTEQATILRVDGPKLLLQCTDQSCESCSSGFCSPKARTFDAMNSNGLELSPGDRVEVYISPARAIRASFIALILPLIALTGTFFVLRSLLPAASEMVHVLGSFAGLVLGFFVSYGLSRLMGSGDLPVVTGRAPALEVPPFIQERIQQRMQQEQGV